MTKRIAFMATGATVARLQPEDPDEQAKESTRRCLAHLDIGENDARDYSDPTSLVPVDLGKEAGKTSWDDVQHDGWGGKVIVHPITKVHVLEPLTLLSARSDGAHVTTFGGDRWPLAASFKGMLYLRAYNYWLHRSAIERNAIWPGPYRACELVSLRYESGYPDGLRYLGFYGELVANISANRAALKIFRPDGIVAGEWAFKFGFGEEVDPTVTVQVLNEDPRVGKALPPIERAIAIGDEVGTRGAVFINLSRAAELWDRTETQNGYGLVGPKLPFWLD